LRAKSVSEPVPNAFDLGDEFGGGRPRELQVVSGRFDEAEFPKL
jgi:hypothetical protein